MGAPWEPHGTPFKTALLTFQLHQNMQFYKPMSNSLLVMLCLTDYGPKYFMLLIIFALTSYMIADVFLEEIPQGMEVGSVLYDRSPTKVISDLKKSIGITVSVNSLNLKLRTRF